MLNLDDIVSNKKKSSSENDDWPFRMLIIGPLMFITFNKQFSSY